MNRMITGNDSVMNTNRIPFRNSYADNLTGRETRECVDQLIRTPEYHYAVTPNSDIVIITQKDPELKRICEDDDLPVREDQIIVNIFRRTDHPRCITE